MFGKTLGFFLFFISFSFAQSNLRPNGAPRHADTGLPKY